MISKRELNGHHVEAYGLSDSQFDAACRLLTLSLLESKDCPDSLEDADGFVDEWLDDEEFEADYREWLKKCVDGNATIYTYKEGWQPISEVAVF